MQTMRIEDGSSLPMAGYMCRNEELQAFSPFPHLHINILLALFRRDAYKGVGWGFERHSVRGNLDARQLRHSLCALFHL